MVLTLQRPPGSSSTSSDDRPSPLDAAKGFFVSLWLSITGYVTNLTGESNARASVNNVTSNLSFSESETEEWEDPGAIWRRKWSPPSINSIHDFKIPEPQSVQTNIIEKQHALDDQPGTGNPVEGTFAFGSPVVGKAEHEEDNVVLFGVQAVAEMLATKSHSWAGITTKELQGQLQDILSLTGENPSSDDEVIQPLEDSPTTQEYNISKKPEEVIIIGKSEKFSQKPRDRSDSGFSEPSSSCSLFSTDSWKMFCEAVDGSSVGASVTSLVDDSYTGIQ